MAKKQDETQEMPVTVETVQEKPLETTETVEIKQGAPGLKFVETEAMPDPALHGKPQEVFIANDETGELTIIYNRLGYAPRPIPAGWRVAEEHEIAGGKHG